jgi:UDP-2,3-diacylglucosamine pyrophosphatase LpxH
MGGYYLTDEQFIAEWNKIGSPLTFAKIHAMSERAVYNRRRSIETRLKTNLPSFNDQRVNDFKKTEQTVGNTRRGMDIEKGRVIVFSDAHFWPDQTTTAFKALIEMIKEYKPTAIVCNGDALDGASISRFPRGDWEKIPSVKEELDACQYFLGEIEAVAKGAKMFWPLGNHDARLEMRIIENLPAFEGVRGTTLKEYFPAWLPCWSFWVNEDTCIKHRWKGGFSAGRSNALNSGVSMITGHTHHLSVMPVNDYNGVRWGVQTGTLAEPNGQQFAYTEDTPKDWNSGFVMLSFERSKLLQPEMIRVWGEDEVEFRGKIHAV